jgi:hypothetical protein
VSWSLLVVFLQGSLRDADGLAGEAWDLADRGFGRHNESDDIPTQNGNGLAVAGDYAVAAHDPKISRVILDRLGAGRQIVNLDEFNADARMRCFCDRSESRDEPIGRTTRRPSRHTKIHVRRPEIDGRDERGRDGQKTCSHKYRRAHWAIPIILVSRAGAKAFFMSGQICFACRAA